MTLANTHCSAGQEAQSAARGLSHSGLPIAVSAWPLRAVRFMTNNSQQLAVHVARHEIDGQARW